MDFISGSSSSLSKSVSDQLAQYRYRVFIEGLGWELDTEQGVEADQFDRPDTQYVVARDEKARIIGCARLLPTTEPYLLEQVFPQLLNGMEPPKSEEIWELSRFAAVDLANGKLSRSGQFSSVTTLELLAAAADCARRNGAKRLISVSPVGVERLLRHTGFRAHRAGPPMIIDGYPLFACWIEIDS